MRITVGIAGLALALAACGSSGQETTVMMMDDSCTLSDSTPKPGRLTFLVENMTGGSARFSVTRNGDEVDYTVLVPGQHKQVSIEVARGIPYQVVCGDVDGPTFRSVG
jgi:hypothetical protein